MGEGSGMKEELELFAWWRDYFDFFGCFRREKGVNSNHLCLDFILVTVDMLILCNHDFVM